MARSRSETASAVSLNRTMAPTASLRFMIGATIAERSGQSRPSQPCFQPTGSRETRRSIIASTAPGGAAQAGAVVVGAEAGVREHAVAVAHRDGGVAEPLARLVGEHLRAGRVEAAAQRRRARPRSSRGCAAAGACPSGTTRPKAARTSPSQATSASVVSATIGTNQRSERPWSCSMRSTTNSSSACAGRQRGADHAAARAPRASAARPSPPPVAGRSRRRPGSRCCGRARSRANDSARLAQRVQLGQRARVGDVVARRAGAPRHEDAELLVVERREPVGVGRDHELDARRRARGARARAAGRGGAAAR